MSMPNYDCDNVPVESGESVAGLAAQHGTQKSIPHALFSSYFNACLLCLVAHPFSIASFSWMRAACLASTDSVASPEMATIVVQKPE
jgi:hypothetical protein